MELTEVLVTFSTRQSAPKTLISTWTIQLPLHCVGLAGPKIIEGSQHFGSRLLESESSRSCIMPKDHPS